MGKEITFKASRRPHWRNRFSFVLAASGSAVGLGNVWKFPYITGENGGGFFVLLYLFLIFLIGVPLFIAELYLGQKSQANAVRAFEVLHRKNSPWRVIGYLGILSAFIILSFYNVIGGWILDFELRSLFMIWRPLSEDQIPKLLTDLYASPWRQIFWHFIFTFISVRIVFLGLSNGIERLNRILMPCLFLLLLVLLGYSFFLEGFSKAISFLFQPRVSEFSAFSLIEAMGQSFFTLSLGMGCIITYGSYLSKKESLIKTAFLVSFLDTAVALIAGVIIFSVVFSFSLEPGAGPGLIFTTLPTLFSKIPGGFLLFPLFFLLLGFAALTSAISILEVIVAYVTEKYKVSRKTITLAIGFFVFFSGWLTVFSTNSLSDFKIFGFTFFGLLDHISSGFLLPVGGILTSLFFGWVVGKKFFSDLFPPSFPIFFPQALLWITRVVAPMSVLVVFLYHLF